MKKYIQLAIACLAITQILHAQKIILHCGKLIDVKNRQVLQERSIIITGNRIDE